ncbi:hypothetical protein B0H11DRAFT_2219170 [Mycena galericulata]|nr:hypothetical protein B0H11DRAFT_2219170 [Mycena galericulata]
MFRTHSQLPFGSSAARPISVNQYSLYPEESTDHDLIRAGRVAAGHDTRWISAVKISRTPTGASTTYEFARGPPESSSKRSPSNLKEWNTSIDSSDDVFSLDQLEEFKNTDLDLLLLVNVKRAHAEGSMDEPPLKRRKLDVASLRNVLPQPHILPSIEPNSIKSNSVTAYSRSKPIPIPPHTLPLPSPVPYTRRSWVVPVRGSLPWQHATSAVMLLDFTDPPEPPDPITHEEITWTAAALASFWSFLLEYFSSNSQPTYTELSGMGAQLLSSDIGTAPSIASSSRRATMPLNLIDHIKVYHDAATSMQIRNILDVWVLETGESKIRLLKGARLVLLDERSKGVLVS